MGMHSWYLWLHKQYVYMLCENVDHRYASMVLVIASTVCVHVMCSRIRTSEHTRTHYTRTNSRVSSGLMSWVRHELTCTWNTHIYICTCLSRPDVMASYSVRIEAPKKSCPILLSNGNLLNKGDLDGDRHFAEWQDPFPKPSYLFALVAGDLGSIKDTFTTKSGACQVTFLSFCSCYLSCGAFVCVRLCVFTAFCMCILVERCMTTILISVRAFMERFHNYLYVCACA